MSPVRLTARSRSPEAGAAARSAEIARMISAGAAALILMPSAMPVSRPAYHASAVASRGRSPSRGMANAKAPNSAAAWARSASEKLEAMMPMRSDVRNSNTAGAHDPGRPPSRPRSAAAPTATMAA